MKTLVDFPELSADEISHSEKLIEKIISKMAGGVISFAEYMQMALYQPGLGYYTAGSTKIGEAGDFITAPEVRVLFGQCMARAFCQRFWQGGGRQGLGVWGGNGEVWFGIVWGFYAPSIQWKRYQNFENRADLI